MKALYLPLSPELLASYPRCSNNPQPAQAAFHEKAGRNQVDFLSCWWVTGFLSAESPLSPPFYPRSVRRRYDVSLNGGYSIYPSFKEPAL